MALFKRGRLNKAIDSALADGKLTNLEISELRTYAIEQGISDEAFEAQFVAKLRERAEHRFAEVRERIEARRRFSFDDEDDLKKVAADLGVGFTLDESLIPYRTLWLIEEGLGNFPRIDVDIRLGGDEACYLQAEAVWQQMKTVTRSHGYVGGSVSFRVARGVSFRVGRAVPVKTVSNELTPISAGVLYITNQRVIFLGSLRSTEMKLSAIVDVVPYDDAVEIVRARGKPDVFLLDTLAHNELARALLAVL